MLFENRYLVASVYNTSSRLVSELLGIFGPGNDREASKYPIPYGINRALGVPTAQASPSVTKDKQSPVWVDLAKDVLGLLREQTTTTPQPTTTQFSLLAQFQKVWQKDASQYRRSNGRMSCKPKRACLNHCDLSSFTGNHSL